MKKIILSIIISSVSLSAMAGGVFNIQIPQPDFISNDWDGDGIINSVDDDDDDDGDLDIDDSTPFGNVGLSVTVDSATCSDGNLTQESVDELNNFQNIYSGDSDYWCSLTSLALYENDPEITSVPDSIGNLTNLTYINLQSNQLTSVPDSIGNLTSLTMLYLRNNQLTSIPDSIGNLTNLSRLYLQNNQLMSVPDSIGNLTSLTMLYLNNNNEDADFSNISCSGISVCYK